MPLAKPVSNRSTVADNTSPGRDRAVDVARLAALVVVIFGHCALLLATIDTDTRIANHHLLYAVRGHLLEMAGCTEEAANSFESAARRTASIPEKRYLTARALGLRSGSNRSTSV